MHRLSDDTAIMGKNRVQKMYTSRINAGVWFSMGVMTCLVVQSMAIASASPLPGGIAQEAETSSADAQPSEPAVPATVVDPTANEGQSDPTTVATDPHPLSVAPLHHAQYPDSRPRWVDDIPDLDADVVVYPVKSLLRATPEEAHESLEVQVRAAAAAYADHVLGEEQSAQISDGALLKRGLFDFTPVEIYEGTAVVGEVTMYEAAARLEFDEAFRRRLQREWRDHEAGDRLTRMGVVGGVGLCLLLAGTGFTRRIAKRHAA